MPSLVKIVDTYFSAARCVITIDSNMPALGLRWCAEAPLAFVR
jgi:hypothetical protein